MTDDMIRITLDSFQTIMNERAFLLAEIDRAREADSVWREKDRTQRDEHQALRDNLHELIGVRVPLSDGQLVEQLRAALRAAREADSTPALATVDRHAQVDHTTPWPLTETEPSGTAAHEVLRATPLAETDQGASATDGPVLLGGQVWAGGRLFWPGEIGFVARLQMEGYPGTVSNSDGQHWDYAGTDQERGHLYANVDRTELATLPELIAQFGTMYEIVRPEDELATEDSAPPHMPALTGEAYSAGDPYPNAWHAPVATPAGHVFVLVEQIHYTEEGGGSGVTGLFRCDQLGLELSWTELLAKYGKVYAVATAAAANTAGEDR